MKKYGIVVDSAIGISEKEVEKLGWGFIPLIVTIDGKDYKDGSDYDSQAFYNMINLKMDIKTSFSPRGLVEEVFEKFSKECEHTIVYTISKGLSAQNNNVKLIAQEYQNIHVIDSYGVGPAAFNELTAIEKQLKDESVSVEQAIEILNEKTKHEFALQLPLTMDWLVKGGRVSGPAAAMAKLLNIQPIIKFENGKLDKHGKGRNFEKTLFICAKEMIKRFPNEQYDYTVWHANNPKINEYFPKLKEIIGQEATLHYYPTIITSHTGPGIILIGVNKK